MTRARRMLPRLGLALLGAHVLWCAARVPGRVIARRADDVASHRQLGRARFLLTRPGVAGADAVEWLLANVPDDAVVLWRGDSKGALEFAPALLRPRLLVAEAACAPEAREHRGRRLATRRDAAGTERVLVLEGLGADLRLVER